jgi:magnesium transporter
VTTEFDKLTLSFLEKHPENAARVLNNLDVSQIVGLAEDTPIRVIAPVFQYMIPQTTASCFIALPAEKQNLLIQELGVNASVVFLRHVSPEQRNPVLESLPTRLSMRVRMQLKFPHGTVGSLMDTDILLARREDTAQDILDKIRQHKEYSESIVYAVDASQRLQGYADVAAIVRSTPDTKIQQIMKPAGHSLTARATIDAIVNHPGWSDQLSLPVLDRDNRVIGRLSYMELINRPVTVGATETQSLNYLVTDIMHLYWQSWISVLNLFFEKRA